jgi:hypothetical protein
MSAEPTPNLVPLSPQRGSTPARLVIVVGTLLLVALVGALLTVSFVSYANVKHRLDAFASDHNANLSRARFGTIVWQVRLAAVLVAGAAAALLRRRRRLAERLDELARSARVDSAVVTGSLRRSLALESPLHLTALGLITIGAVLVRVDFLFQPMRYDEADTYVHYASRPLYIGLTSYTAPNNHLLHTLLVHISSAVLGDSPWAIRLPAFVAGVLMVPAAYLTGRFLYGKAAALVGAALVATSSTLIEYSTNARGYTLLALIVLLLLALSTRLVATASPASWAAFALLAALGFWTIPIMLYALAAITAWLVWTIAIERRNRTLLRTRLLPALLGASALTLIFYTPVLVAAGPHALLGNSFVAPRPWSYVDRRLSLSFLATFGRWHRDQPAPLWWLIAAGFLVGLVFHGRLSRFRVPPAAAVVLVVPPLVVMQRVVPFERVWLFLLPLYLLTAAAGLLFAVGSLRDRPWFQVAVTIASVALCASLAGEAVASRAVYRSEDTSTFRDAPAVAAFLERRIRPGDRVLAAPPADQILEYYLDAAGFDAGRILYQRFQARRAFAVVKEGSGQFPLAAVLRRNLAPSVRARSRVILLRRFPHAVVYRLVALHPR